MDLRQKIEAEIDRLEKQLEHDTLYNKFKELEEQISTYAPYQTLQTLQNLLTEYVTEKYKILDIDRESRKRGKIAKQLNLKDTSHYKEMVDFIEAHMELDPKPFDITSLYNIVADAGYEVGGKKPPYTLSAILSKDQRFTPTNKGWILTKKANEDAV